MSVIRLKQGAKFSIDVQYTEPDGITPKSLEGITILSLIRDTNFVVHAKLDVTIIDEVLGLYSLSAPLGTSDWPAGMLFWDVTYSDSGFSEVAVRDNAVKETVAIEVLRTESLSNTKIVNLGSSGEVNILNDTNFRIDSGSSAVWVENKIENNAPSIFIHSKKFQQRFKIANKMELYLNLNLSGGEPVYVGYFNITFNGFVTFYPVTLNAGYNIISIPIPSTGIPIYYPGTVYDYSIQLDIDNGSPLTGSVKLEAIIVS